MARDIGTYERAAIYLARGTPISLSGAVGTYWQFSDGGDPAKKPYTTGGFVSAAANLIDSVDEYISRLSSGRPPGEAVSNVHEARGPVFFGGYWSPSYSEITHKIGLSYVIEMPSPLQDWVGEVPATHHDDETHLLELESLPAAVSSLDWHGLAEKVAASCDALADSGRPIDAGHLCSLIEWEFQLLDRRKPCEEEKEDYSDILTPKQISEFFPDFSWRTIKRRMKEGEIRYIEINSKAYRIHREDFPKSQ